MRNMRSSLPVFILVGLALFTVIGVIIVGTSSTSAIVEVNNTSTEELPLAIYHTDYYLAYGLATVLLIVAAYFALKALT